MAPRRNNSLLDGSVLTDMQNLQLDMLLMESQQQQAAPHELVTTCCVPSGDCLRGNELIYLNNNNNNCAGGGANFLEDVVRVRCSNEACAAGRFMHRECFEHWEEGVLAFVRSSGRARSWSERQRHQNLWTKKGYDLAFRACGCACGRGFLKKDVDWCAAAAAAVAAAEAANGAACDAEKKRRKRRQNARPTLALSAFCGANGYASSPAAAQHAAAVNGGRPAENAQTTPVELRARTVSVSSSSNGSSSPPASSSQCSSNSPTTVPLPGVIGSGQKKKKKTKKPDP